MPSSIHWQSYAAAEVAPDADGVWVSPLVTPGFGFDELVASWNASTPVGTLLEVAAQVVSRDGDSSRWALLARWSSDPSFPSGTVPGQADQLVVVDDDTLRARDDVVLTGYRLRVRLVASDGAARPRVSLLGAMVSAGARGASADAAASGPVLVEGVPAYSQQLHRGTYPQWDGGGRSWCSPASVAMVLDFWGVGPTEAELAWVGPGTPDPQVVHAAREAFDHGAHAAGTWPFNTAYAATRGLTAYVTRLRSLAEAADFLRDGVPLVLSVAHGEGELTGAGYTTAGHLLVLVGIDEAGDAVVHDPASHGVPDDARVPVTYAADELERAWSRSGRIVYVIRP